MGVQTFADLDAMSLHQCNRELHEALRVRAMSPAAFSSWLKHTLTPLQTLAGGVFDADDEPFQPAARCFQTPADKQRYDDEQELARALRLALKRSMNAGQP